MVLAEGSAATASSPAPQEIVVRGESRADRLRHSAQAVDVVELSEARRKSADLGQILAKSSSLRVQREGGLGSMGRYSLNGLSGDRVRFFLDGVPLELTAYQMGIGNVPVGLVDRVELYQGVVPVRFGADALGGAINLVGDERPRDSRAFASYQLGSFETHRLELGGLRYFDGPRAFVRANAFYDTSANDYPIDVESFDDQGKLSPATVKRFHDGYRGAGVTLAAGLVGRPYADRLVAQAFIADYDRDVQHNPGMTVPYGEITYGRSARGGQLSYRKLFAGALRVDAVAGYAARDTSFVDLSRCRYDWYGRCFIQLPLAGELDSVPTDRLVLDGTWFARAELQLRLGARHALRLAVSPTLTRRHGQDRQIAAENYDALRATRRVQGGILGFEYEGTAAWLSASSFVKAYLQSAESEAKLPTGVVQRPRAHELLFGAGDSLRVALREGLYLKASYEYAARLPTADERFGDGGLVADNIRISAERSHNYNAGAYLERLPLGFGELDAKLVGGLRRVDAMIVLLNTGSYYQYGNVLTARALSGNASVAFRALTDRVGVELSSGYEDVRNTSRTGPGALFEGDRIPNMPYFQAGASTYARARGAFLARDTLELGWSVRYVREFFRGWESAGQAGAKLTIPSQTVHALGVTHVLPGERSTLSNSFEVFNLTDAKAFDFYGVQRPGRSFFWKTSLEYQ